MSPATVTLSSDFGSYYPGAMRGVLARRGIDRVIDVTHDLPRQDIYQGAFWLHTLVPYFPPAVHCVVVDPGVGGDRDVLILRAGGHILVGPDNGILWPTAQILARDETVDAFTFEHVPPDSQTFHGRDVFAPLTAAIAHLGLHRFEQLPTVTRTENPITLTFPGGERHADHAIVSILAVDGFGNAITNLPGEVLPTSAGAHLRVDAREVPFASTYGAVNLGQPLVTIGSHGYVELAVNGGRGDRAFGVEPGDELSIRWE